MLQINLVLCSGRTEKLSIEQSSKVGDLRIQAQKSFRLGFLKLVTSEARILIDPTETLEAAGIQEGDHLTVVPAPAAVAATPPVRCRGMSDRKGAFAVWCPGSDRVLAWGDPQIRGDSSVIQEQLRKVQQIQTTLEAFAAILTDGSVVTWGEQDAGGDSSAVRDQLRNVHQMLHLPRSDQMGL